MSRCWHLLVLLWHSVIVCGQEPCNAPSANCLSHRKCAFGTLENYEDALKTTSKLTGCDNCINDCGACTCDTNNSTVQNLIDDEHFCDNNICNKTSVTLMMNYLIDNYNDCEQEVSRIQPLLIQLCGKTNGICCKGKCDQSYQITVPPSMCDQVAGIKGPTRWILTAYTILAITLAQLAYAKIILINKSI